MLELIPYEECTEEQQRDHSALLEVLEGAREQYLVEGWTLSLALGECTFEESWLNLESIREPGDDFEPIAVDFMTYGLEELGLEYVPERVLDFVLTVYFQFHVDYPQESVSCSLFHPEAGLLYVVLEVPRRKDVGCVILKLEQVKLRVLH